jgi:hypothetical protein
MVQRGGRLGFLDEPARAFRVRGQIGAQDLEGDEALEASVLGLVDHTHPAGAELRQDLVVTQDLSDHRVIGRRQYTGSHPLSWGGGRSVDRGRGGRGCAEARVVGLVPAVRESRAQFPDHHERQQNLVGI